MDNVKKEKTELNEEQLRAIEHKSGPVLVVAGAGTGKTRVITERIKHLIQEKGCNPNEILALTFTEKAAEEMVMRVGDIMPLGYEEPWVSTFHSFADRILRERGIEIGIDPSYKIISGAEQWMLIRKRLFSLELDYFRPLGNPTKFISEILKFISKLQDENIKPKDLEMYVYQRTYETDEEKLKYEELSYIYTEYERLKIENSMMDFGNLISWLIELFTARPNILSEYQEQFKHVLVDEFQDTNYSQYELIKLLYPTNTKNENRSLLAVGDDSQSIYKFRGAAISNILQFMEDYKTAYCLKNIDFIQKIFDDDALIIVGNVLKKYKSSDSFYFSGLSEDEIKYQRLTKSEYINRLKRIFTTNEFINIHFEDNVVKKANKDLSIYGIQIAQHYASDTYADKGYLFLMVDLRDTINPIIHVRTWQPRKNDDGSIYGLEDFPFMIL